VLICRMALDPLNPPDESSANARHADAKPSWREQERNSGPTITPVALALIAVSIAVAIYSNLGNKIDSLLPLFITQYESGPAALWEVRHGQVWRLFTPAFIHFGIVHLIFNMLWVKDLGTLIERRHGSWFLLGLAAVLAVTSNVGQYLVSGPVFGGMSGVVYGLFGYVWLRGRADPASGFYMPSQTVLIMLGWFVLCVMGVIPRVANTAHGVGLVVGTIWGVVSGRFAPTVSKSTP
jgi:GlpG protein